MGISHRGVIRVQRSSKLDSTNYMGVSNDATLLLITLVLTPAHVGAAKAF
jgi:hypothetical protein